MFLSSTKINRYSDKTTVNRSDLIRPETEATVMSFYISPQTCCKAFLISYKYIKGHMNTI